MKLLILLLLYCIIILGCKSNAGNVIADSLNIKKEEVTTSEIIKKLPLCISEKIENIKNNEVRNPPTIVQEWVLNDKKYYLIPSGCCDQFDYIIDENCKTVCSQGYGVSGKFNTGCDTLIHATRTIVWRDKRNY